MIDLSLPKILPILPVPGMILMPKSHLVVPIIDLEGLSIVADTVKEEMLVGIVQSHPGVSLQEGSPVFKTGTVGKILEINEIESNSLLVTFGGICRFRIESENQPEDKKSYRMAVVNYDRYVSDLVQTSDFAFNRSRLIQILKVYFKKLEISPDWTEIDGFSNERLVTTLSMACPFEVLEKQALLEIPTIQQQSELMLQLLEIQCFMTPHHTETIQ